LKGAGDSAIATPTSGGTALTLNLGALAGEDFVYLNIHLDYGLEKSNGWTRSGENAINDPAVNPTLSGVNIIEPTTYTFSSSIAGTDDNDSIQNNNEFKTIKGFGGLVEVKSADYIFDGDTIAVRGAVVKLYKDANYTNLLDQATTDQNGWYYMQNFQHKGKTTTYYLQLDADTNQSDGITYAQVRKTTTIGGSDKFGEGYFVVDDTTLPAGLNVANGPNSGARSGADLTRDILAPVVDAAINYWAARGVTSREIQKLEGTDILIGNLGGTLLGQAEGATITLDDDAAGYGWSDSLTAVDPDEVDLLSALTHEFGHLLGYTHDTMGETLGVGQRQLPLSLEDDHLLQSQFLNLGANPLSV
jgi:hypothetical protein